MIHGYKRALDGKFLPLTRVSNSTFIDYPHKFEIENNVYIGHHNFIEASNGIKIEEGCQITNFVTITSHSSHDSIRINNHQTKDKIAYHTGSIEINKYSFIGPYSTIMPNTKIGKGCMVCAYSYLQGEFPDFSIIKGNPAKVVGSVKDRDQEFLNNDPEIIHDYNKWVKNE